MTKDIIFNDNITYDFINQLNKKKRKKPIDWRNKVLVKKVIDDYYKCVLDTYISVEALLDPNITKNNSYLTFKDIF